MTDEKELERLKARITMLESDNKILANKIKEKDKEIERLKKTCIIKQRKITNVLILLDNIEEEKKDPQYKDRLAIMPNEVRRMLSNNNVIR